MAINVKFKYKSTAVITYEFQDEKGKSAVPKQCSWTLTNSSGEVINNRQDISIDDLSSEINVVLQGDDLIESLQYIIFKGIYDSDIGANLSFREWDRFYVELPPNKDKENE